MKIYDHAGLPNPLRARIALAEKGLLEAVTFVHVDVLAGEPRQAAFRAKNPAGAVPVLELDDGACISECTAITEYVDHLDGDPWLTGRTPCERATIHMMQRRAEAGLLDAVAAYFHHATPGLGPALEVGQIPAWGERNRARALATMADFDARLGASPYLAGEGFSVADITAYAGLAFADVAALDVPEGLANLAAWRKRVADRPAVRAAEG